jgi:glutamyl-tRNA synthetase
MTLANSNFEEWRLANPKSNIFDFNLDFAKMSLDGALFDLEKVKSISKEVLGNMNKDDFAEKALMYANEYDKELKMIIEEDLDYFKDIINIEREQEKPRKDYEKFSDILPIINFMYDRYYYDLSAQVVFNERFAKDFIIELLSEYRDNFDLNLDQENWFNGMKELALNRGFAQRAKQYNKEPEKYVGHIGEYAEILRLATCAKTSTPNFYDVLRILGRDKVIERINHTIAILNAK